MIAPGGIDRRGPIDRQEERGTWHSRAVQRIDVEDAAPIRVAPPEGTVAITCQVCEAHQDPAPALNAYAVARVVGDQAIRYRHPTGASCLGDLETVAAVAVDCVVVEEAVGHAGADVDAARAVAVDGVGRRRDGPAAVTVAKGKAVAGAPSVANLAIDRVGDDDVARQRLRGGRRLVGRDAVAIMEDAV